MITDILIPLIAITVAELGDKTQLSILLLSSKTQKHLQLLLGVTLAFLIVDGTAIILGGWITNVIPTNYLKIASGAVFIILGIVLLMQKQSEEESKLRFKNTFLAGFALIFISEWGDKTQITSALFATQYNSALVLIGTMTGLVLLSILTVFIGKLISEKINKKLVTKVAAVVFIIVGISFFFI